MPALATPMGRALLERIPTRYLLLARFNGAIAAPLPTPLPMDVGSLTLVDASSVFSQVGGRLLVSGTPAAHSSAAGAALGRMTGRALLWTMPTLTTIGSSARVGFRQGNDSGIDYGFFINNSTSIRIAVGGGVADSNVPVGAAPWCCAAIMRATSGLLLIRSGLSGPYTLYWVYDATAAGGSHIPQVRLQSGSALDFTVDDFRVTDLGGAFASDYGIASSRLATTANGDTSTSNSDALVEHTITAATGVSQEISVRRTTDADRWIVRMDQTGATVKLIEVVATVETERATAAQTWTNAVAYRVVVTQEAAVIKVYVAEALKLTYSSASSNQTATGLKVSHAGANLIAWPRFVSLPAAA